MTGETITLFDAAGRKRGERPLTIGEAAALMGRPVQTAAAASAGAADAAWFAVTAAPQQETLAAAHLIGRRIATYIPAVARFIESGRRKQWRTMPMFGGYLFIHVSRAGIGDVLYRIRHLPGVGALVETTAARSADAALAESDIALMREAERQSFARKAADLRSGHHAYEGPLEVGQMARVRKGSMEGLQGPVTEILDAERVTVLLLIFGRPTPTTMTGAMLEPA